jgi:hypothetical protein
VNEDRDGEIAIWALGRWEFFVRDGKGCPVCGAIGEGRHGTSCPHWKKQFRKNGKEL